LAIGIRSGKRTSTQQCLAYYSKGAFNCAFAAPAPPPVASNVTATGANVLTGSTLTATYTYSQSTGIASGTPAYQWYYATDASGTGKAVVPGASGSTYTIAAPVTPMVNHIAVAVTPVTTTGTAGAQVLSPWRAVVNNAAPYFSSLTNSICFPVVSYLAIIGSTYYDAESDAADTPIYQWYRFSDTAGNGKAAIAGANAATYNFTSADIGSYVKAGVTAKATTGTLIGSEQLTSTYLGPIVAYGTGPMTYTHTGGTIAPITKTITYNVVPSSVTGSPKCWITQNLGATSQPISATDVTTAATGWQWQFNRVQGYYATSASTFTPASWNSTGDPATSNWAINNDPCYKLLGAGWRIPTHTEIQAVISAYPTEAAAFASPLKISYGGRIDYTGNNYVPCLYLMVSDIQTSGTAYKGNATNYWGAIGTTPYPYTSYAGSVRCIKD